MDCEPIAWLRNISATLDTVCPIWTTILAQIYAQNGAKAWCAKINRASELSRETSRGVDSPPPPPPPPGLIRVTDSISLFLIYNIKKFSDQAFVYNYYGSDTYE